MHPPHRIHSANIPDPDREPRIVFEPQDLPIPIDAFALANESDVQIHEQATKLPDELHFWISLGPQVKKHHLTKLCLKEGISGLRINVPKFKSRAELRHYLEVLVDLRTTWPARPSICLDLGGPKIRVRQLREISGKDYIDLFEGDKVVVVGLAALDDALASPALEAMKIIPIDAPTRALKARENDVIFMSDGWLQLRVMKNCENYLLCRSLHDCRMWDGRGVDVPGIYDARNPLNDVDTSLFRDIEVLLPEIDYFALSFTNRQEEIEDFKRLLQDVRAAARAVAKIETRTGVSNVRAIAECAGTVMLARGDLAVQLAGSDDDLLSVEDRVREVCRTEKTECIIATRVADSLEAGGERLSSHEIRRLHHELALGPPLTLMLAQETLDGHYAARNFEIVVGMIKRLLPAFAARWRLS